MTRFYNVTQAEMESLILPQGFVKMNFPESIELVYGKIIRKEGHKVSLRVFTGINPNGQSRAKGEDAIRVIPYIMFEGKPTPIAKSTMVRRIETWSKNLQKAIDKWDTDWKVCPACGYPMILRHGRNGDFWGCSTWVVTKCKGKPKPEQRATPQPAAKQSLYEELMGMTKNDPQRQSVEVPKPVEKPAPKPVDPQNPMAKYRIPEHKISKHQKQAELAFVETDLHVLLPSRAGGGKTTMLKHLASFRKSGERMVYLAFNSKNAREGVKKLPREVPSRTTHSFCASMLRDHGIKLAKDVSKDKNWQVMQDVYPAMNNDDRKRIRKACFKLIGLAKNFALRPDDKDGIRNLCLEYELVLMNDREVNEAVDIVSEVLALSLPGQKFGSIHDFDDMIWWPIVLGHKPKFYHVVLLDEVQDFNACQLELVQRLLDQGTRVVAVGDPYQAVYRFRGADSDAFDKMDALLNGDKRGCRTVLLPTNYRSGRKIIEWVRENTIVKDIEAAPDAIEGEVEMDMGYTDLLDMLTEEFAQAA